MFHLTKLEYMSTYWDLSEKRRSVCKERALKMVMLTISVPMRIACCFYIFYRCFDIGLLRFMWDLYTFFVCHCRRRKVIQSNDEKETQREYIVFGCQLPLANAFCVDFSTCEAEKKRPNIGPSRFLRYFPLCKCADWAIKTVGTSKFIDFFPVLIETTNAILCKQTATRLPLMWFEWFVVWK